MTKEGGGARRRIIGVAFVVIVTFLYTLFLYSPFMAAHRTFFSGWTLACMILALSGYHWRKIFQVAPLGPVKLWLQVHIYLGLFTGALFFLHAPTPTPDGVLDTIIWLLAMVVFVSGLAGILLSRLIAQRLSIKPEEEIYERIPGRIAKLQEKTESAIIEVAAKSGSETLSKLYERFLSHFYAGPQDRWLHLAHSDRPYAFMQREFDEIARYLGPEEKTALAYIAELAIEKVHLDFHYANQWALRLWRSIHYSATYSLLALVVAHVFLAYAYVLR